SRVDQGRTLHHQPGARRAQGGAARGDRRNLRHPDQGGVDRSSRGRGRSLRGDQQPARRGGPRADRGARHDPTGARGRALAGRAAGVLRRHAPAHSARATGDRPAQPAAGSASTLARRVNLAGIFWIFFRAGLAFGGGLGILAVLEKDVVTRRRLVTRDELLTAYALGRILPTVTMMAASAPTSPRPPSRT